MQVIKPKRLGIIHKPYQLKFHHFSVAAMAFFPLSGEANKEGKLLQEYEQWQKCLSQLPMGESLDMGFAKPRSELLIAAKGYPHQHGLFYKCRAGVEMGKIKKRVRVSRSKKDYITEFMPVDIMSKQRSKYNGTYDKKWVETVHPGLPEDTNPLLFNSAPTDQQLRTGVFKGNYFTPGCEYTLHDLHPEKKNITGNLPNIQVRIFVTLKENVLDKKSATSFVELDTVLETVWFFPEENLGLAMYRGVAQVNDSDALDVKELMMAYESVDDKPRSVDYYKNVLSLRTHPDTALAHLFNESQLMPEKTAEEILAMEVLIKEKENETQQQADILRQQYTNQAADIINKALPEGSPGYQETQDGLNNSEPDESNAYEIETIPTAVLESGDFDLTPLLSSGSLLFSPSCVS